MPINPTQPCVLTSFFRTTTIAVGAMAHVSKITAERNQRTLLELATLPGNGEYSSRRLPQYSITLMSSLTEQTSVLIAKRIIHDGPLITLACFCGEHSRTTTLINSDRKVSVTCASVHRKIGVHVSKVSVVFDAYTFLSSR